jgi:integrase
LVCVARRPTHAGPTGTKEFRAAYRNAIAGMPAGPAPKAVVPKAATMQTVVDQYLDSQKFAKLAERTQRDYRKHAKAITVQFGDLSLDVFIAEFEDKLRGRFVKWRDKLAKASERQADYAWSVLSAILSWAKKMGEIKVNPCRGADVEKLYDGNRSDKTWNDDWVTAFYEVASDELALAMALALWTGQRQGDLLNLVWDAYDGKVIRLRQGKGGINVTIPVGAPLKLALDHAAKARKKFQEPSERVLVNQDGLPWTEDGFRVMWGKTCWKAKVPNSRHGGVTFHDLRGTAVTRLFIVGCNEGEIATITGHTLAKVRSILDKNYFNRDVRLAESAIEKYEASSFAALEQSRFGAPVDG